MLSDYHTVCINEYFLSVGGVCMNQSKCQLIYIAFWSRYCALFAQKLAYSYCRHWKWCIFSGLKSSVNFLIAAFNAFALHVPVKLIYLYFILASLFYFKEIKMVLINLDWHGNKILSSFWQLKIWPGFCWSGRVLVSFWAGNRQPDLATLVTGTLTVNWLVNHLVTVNIFHISFHFI